MAHSSLRHKSVFCRYSCSNANGVTELVESRSVPYRTTLCWLADAVSVFGRLLREVCPRVSPLCLGDKGAGDGRHGVRADGAFHRSAVRLFERKAHDAATRGDKSRAGV